MATLATIIAAVLVFTGTASAELRDDLVSYWPFEEVTPEVTPDLISGNDLFLYKIDSSHLVSGRFGNALSFDGKSQFLALNYPQSPKLPIHAAKAYSVAFWVKGPANQSNRMVFAEGLTTDKKPLFLLGTHGKGEGMGINAMIRSTTDPLLNNVSSETAVFDDRWHYVTWVDDGGLVRLYVDGLQDSVNFNYERSRVPLNNLSIGALLRSPPMYFFKGLVDEVAIWKRALSESEIRELTKIPLSSLVLTRN